MKSEKVWEIGNRCNTCIYYNRYEGKDCPHQIRDEK